MGGRTHCVTARWVQHGSWSTEQAEELGVPPLLCWQVPAWVDHLQRQQCRRHRLGEGQENERETMSEEDGERQRQRQNNRDI